MWMTRTFMVVAASLAWVDAAGAAVPERVWGTYVGGEFADYEVAVAVDEAGNIYVVGTTYSSTGIATPGAYKSIRESGDAYLMKFDPAGKRLWGTYFGGPQGETVYVVTARGGKVVFGGHTGSATGMATPGAFDTTRDNVTDGFVACFTDAGMFEWGTYVGGELGVHAEDVVWDLALDAQGDVYVTGRTSGVAGIGSPGAHQPNFGGGSSDAYLLRLGAQGQRIWGTYYGGSGADIGYGVALGPDGVVYLGGQSSSASGIATPGTFQPVKAAGGDGFVARLDDSGARVWGTYFGGSEQDVGGSVAVYPGGGVVYAHSGKSTGQATPGVHQALPGGDLDAVVARFDADGQRLWSTYIGGAKSEAESGLVVGADGAIHVAGETQSAAGIATPDAFQTALAGSIDVFAMRLDGAGQRVWGTYYGGPGAYTRYGRVARIAGGIVVAGYTYAPTGIATPGAHKEVVEDTDDFLVRFQDGDAGLPCAGPQSCDGALCVDGVCCDTACGGGDASDCQACSVAAGGAVDGVCGPRGPGECRPSTGACDVAEACDGASPTCPEDQAAVDGTACEDDGMCEAGVCTHGETGPGTSGSETTGAVGETGATTTDTTSNSISTSGASATEGSSASAPTGGSTDPVTGGISDGDSLSGSSSAPTGDAPPATTATDDTGVASDTGGATGGAPQGTDAGCGCTSAPPSSLAIGLVLLTLRRRRRAA